MDRRGFVTGLAGASLLGLGGCAGHRSAAIQPSRAAASLPPKISPPNHVLAMYAAAPQERFPLPAVEIHQVAVRYWRKRVSFVTRHRPGSIIVDTGNFHLYFVEPGGTAMRYGVSLGQAGFSWSGTGVIQWKRPWPTWTPPAEMITRLPDLAEWSAENGGMPPGPENPLGARALYIFQNGRDTLYRVHGTPDISSIGSAASSGCVRMLNQDVIDLFNRVRPGARIVVA